MINHDKLCMCQYDPLDCGEYGGLGHHIDHILWDNMPGLFDEAFQSHHGIPPGDR